MSLRTKILAAVVGLNVVVLAAAILVLLFGATSEDRRAEIESLVEKVRVAPVSGDAPRAERRRNVDLVWTALPGVVVSVLWLEELDDPERSAEPTPLIDAGTPAPSTEDVEEAVRFHKAARRTGRNIRAADRLLVLLEPTAEDGGGDGGAPEGRQSLYVRWHGAATLVSRARALYFTLLAGILAVTSLGWVLLSRLVVRPLARLAEAADRVASGDLGARVPTSGTGDEIDRTAQAFNRMAAEVSEHQSQLEDRVMSALSRVRKAEQHLAIAQRLTATGKLASGIAHEINNPLGGMRSAVRALQRGDLDAVKTAEYLDLVADGLGRVEETVKKVLQFTPRTPKPRPTDLRDVARKAAALARHRIERDGVRLVERLPAEAVPVYGDPFELQQVALNLLLNASDAVVERAPPGARGGQGEVSLAVSADAETAVLEVRDDGVGMTPEVAAQCFDLFFSTKDVGEGTGLGLAVVHNIVTNHGGRIDVETAPGQGTTMRVLLPRDSPAGDPSPGGDEGPSRPADPNRVSPPGAPAPAGDRSETSGR